ELLMDRRRPLRISARPSRDRLGTLALAVSQDPHGVHGEGLLLAPVLQMGAQKVVVLLQPGGGGDFRGVFSHAAPFARNLVDGKVCGSSASSTSPANCPRTVLPDCDKLCSE